MVQIKKGPAGSFLCLTRLHDTLNNLFCFCEAEIDQDRPVEHPGVKVFYRLIADIQVSKLIAPYLTLSKTVYWLAVRPIFMATQKNTWSRNDKDAFQQSDPNFP